MVSGDDNLNVTLRYDPLGRLYQVFDHNSNTGTHFVYSGDSLMAEYRNGAMVKRYVHGGGRLAPLVA